ncbi:helix-turn-helix domain-containing protein [Sphingorhabdus sp. Alg239-R122]|uniref:helix-turn-helix domain-containing protein n=1 Tax=Sphingorhabdus sp. Alg239-R122 TaxID=2305989 RepID=UPI0013DC7A18|nr:helix-turn-helix domain-containing protein [Sphingorhabdus sp. Alg239-R122]
MTQLHYRLPHPNLREFFSLYYLLDSQGPVRDDHERAGMAQIRFILKGEGQMEFGDGHLADCAGAFIVGPSATAMKFSLSNPFYMFGMGFLPAGWGALTGKSAADYTDRAIAATELFPAIERHVKTLSACADADEMTAAADAVLLPLIRDADPKIIEFTRMVDGWLASDVSPDINTLHDQTQLSDRQLTRKVKQYYGHPPKYLARKYRALRAARAFIEADPDEADFLRDAFYDQSHMIREVKLFTGTTPAKLRTQESEFAELIDQRAQYDGQINPLSSQT